MRPLLLEMQGFGPYGEKVVVDFTQFANGGLYLVTGETGSGKTFIFDGICYALYGEVSGGERKTEMLRTMGIEDDVDTYVKLRFLCHGQEYEIFRKPAYERAKKRGEGKVMDNARVEFVFGTTTLTRAEEVNAKIKEIIGLNVEQFKQIVMIAQGKFAQILQKSTKERRELLREIFNTNAYINLEYHIKDKHTALVNEYEARKREINDKLHEITASDEQYAQELQDMQQAEFVQVERVLELLQQFDKIDKELLKKHNEEIERLQKEEVQLKIALEKANTFVQQTEKLTKLEKQKTAADSAAAKAKEDAGKVSEALLFFTDCREQQANTKNALLELRNLFTLSHENQKAKVNLLNIGNDLKKAAEEALQEKKQYDNVYGAFLMAQAGIIAETLQEGIPCPVCGALEHPSPAQLSSAAPTEEAVKDAKQAFDVAEGARQRIQGKLDNAKVVKEDALKNYLAAVSDFYQEDVTGLDLATIDKRVTEDGTNTSLRLKELERQEKDKEKELGMLPNESVEQYQKRIQEKALKSGQEAAAVDGAIKNLKEEIAKLGKTENVDDLRKKSSENLRALGAVKEQADIVKARQMLNAASAKSIQDKQAAMAKIEAERQEIDNLYRTLSGNLNNASATKLSFETYMQQAYFDRILAYANNRLLKISHARYKLVRKDDNESKGNAKVGLDLNVHDAHSGKERSANSLSGGETFMASLAMALGMADEVQASAGGINIETMFIDEGFGSLSKDFLNTTVDVLDTLADNQHLVGIISHIEELKERIEQQIVVTRNEKGYSKIAVEI